MTKQYKPNLLHIMTQNTPEGSNPLKQKCKDILPEEFGTEELHNLIDDMTYTMNVNAGVGLASSQIGDNRRIVIISDGRCKPYAMINPIITYADGEELDAEGCLSFPRVFRFIPRATFIKVEFCNAEGTKFTMIKKGMEARVIQHELDHLDGNCGVGNSKFKEYIPSAEEMARYEEMVSKIKERYGK